MDLPRVITIRESGHRIHNPLTADQLATLGQALRLPPAARVLDLASGSGELLCTWARDHHVTGTGVDISTAFTASAEARAVELGVADRVRFVHGDATGYVAPEPVDLAACLGATWIGGGVAGIVGPVRPTFPGPRRHTRHLAALPNRANTAKYELRSGALRCTASDAAA